MIAFIEGMFSPMHVAMILLVGVLLFGKKIPEIARSLGSSIVEFKKGLAGIEKELDVDKNLNVRIEIPQRVETPLQVGVGESAMDGQTTRR